MDYKTREVFDCLEWADEISPASGTLEKIADKLAQGVRHSEESEAFWVDPQPIPSDHLACRLVYAYVPCRRDDNGAYDIPEDLPGKVHALAFYEGSGWDPEMLVDDIGEARALLAQEGTDPVEWLVCVVTYQEGTIHLTEGPKATFTPQST